MPSAPQDVGEKKYLEDGVSPHPQSLTRAES
jgi:hypothetical protein